MNLVNFKNIIFERENNIAIIKINRPKVLNTLNSETLKELELLINYIGEDDEIYAVVLTGEGKAFAAGADITEMKDLNAIDGRRFGILGSRVFRKIELLTKPIIAAVNGYALGGGCELCMACDIRLASKKAKFGQSEVSLGIIPGFGGTQRLARLVGMGMAKQLLFTGDIIDAEEALRIGLINKIIEPEKLLNEAKALANKIASNAPIAVKLCKEAINRGIQVDMDTGLMYESEAFGICFSTEDQKEGMTAFIEKRDKYFKNR
jgi:enoyl-CoA hydratase